MEKKYIMSGYYNHIEWLKSINSEEIKPEKSGYPASTSAIVYKTPVFSGLITTEYNSFYGEIIRSDRIKGKAKKEYNKLKLKYAPGQFKPFSYHSFNYALYDELFYKNKRILEEEFVKKYNEIV